jgi:hypothetical protein
LIAYFFGLKSRKRVFVSPPVKQNPTDADKHTQGGELNGHLKSRQKQATEDGRQQHRDEQKAFKAVQVATLPPNAGTIGS